MVPPDVHVVCNGKQLIGQFVDHRPEPELPVSKMKRIVVTGYAFLGRVDVRLPGQDPTAARISDRSPAYGF